jgi:peptide/nickel transport system substrate-binding protein
MSDTRQVGRRNGLLTGLAVTAIAVLVTACGSAAATPTPAPATAAPTVVASVAPTAAPTSAIPMGGSMTILISSDISSWDPCTASSTTPTQVGDLYSMVYGNLVWTDTKGVVQPGMAKGLTTTDAITWTLKLRDGVKFQDGHAYDADAVKYNWDRAADPANSCSNQKWYASWISGVTVTDATTLTIKLPSADSNFALKVAELIPFVASPAALAAAAKKTDIKPLGAGPFQNTAWNQGVSSTFVRNPIYWDAPRPYLDGLKVSIVSDTNQRISTVVQGGGQFMSGYPFQFGSNATATHVATWKIDVPGFNVLWFNNKTGIMSDLNARKAVWAAMDMNLLVQALTTDTSLKAPTTYVPSTSPYYDATLTFPKYDKAAAQTAFTALIAAGKKDIKVTHPNNSDTNRAASYIQQVLSGYGMNVIDNAVPLANWNDVATNTHDYDIGVQPGIMVYNGPEPNTYNYMKSGLTTNSALYASTAMDGFLAAAMSATNDADKKAAYINIQKQFLTDLPFAIYGLQNRYFLMRDNTCGIVNAGQGQVQYQYLYLANFPGQC